MTPDVAQSGSAPRRYLTVIQDGRGYPPPGDLDPAPPDGPAPPMIVQVVKADDHDLERNRAFYRGWRMAMELVAGEAEERGEPVPDAAVEGLRPCEHDALTGGICDWCCERVEPS